MSGTSGFRAELERLEEIVRQLEGEDLDLDRALVLFEDGVKRLKAARKLLDASERKVKQVVAEAGGTLREEEVDV